MCLKTESLPHDRAAKITFQKKKKKIIKLSLYRNLLLLKYPKQSRTTHLLNVQLWFSKGIDHEQPTCKNKSWKVRKGKQNEVSLIKRNEEVQRISPCLE